MLEREKRWPAATGDCPILTDAVYILTLVGMVCVPAVLICIVGVLNLILAGEAVLMETWVMDAGFLSCAGAALWSLRRCRGQKWNLPVQTVLAAVGAAAGWFTSRVADEPIEFSLAMAMDYPAVLAALHGLWSLIAAIRRQHHG